MEESEKEEEPDRAQDGSDARLEGRLQPEPVPSPCDQGERNRPGAHDPELRHEAPREEGPKHPPLVTDRAGPEKLRGLIARIARDEREREERPDRKEAESEDLELPPDREPAQEPHGAA